MSSTENLLQGFCDPPGADTWSVWPMEKKELVQDFQNFRDEKREKVVGDMIGGLCSDE